MAEQPSGAPASPPALPPAPLTPPRAPLPRAGTFRAQRPVSTGTGLRRGTTFSHRPQSYSGDPSSLLHDEPVLRRSIQSKPASPDERPLRRSSIRDSTRLPRAGTFSIGSTEHRAVTTVKQEDVHMRRMSSTDKVARTPRTCGMCSSCSVGHKAMPPWAPERLRTLPPAERAVVLQQLRQKEEKGRLEAELRKKRLADLQQVSARLQARRADSNLFRMDSSRTEELEPMRPDALGLGGRGISEENADMESVDLGTDRELGRKASSKRGRSRSAFSGTELAGNGENATIVEAVPESEGKIGKLDDECEQYDGLELQVSDLEEQLGVLREVVEVCSQTESERDGQINGEIDQEASKKPKSWKDKVLGAYYGNSSNANERARLKEEVEALRKATDFLFAKMQQGTNAK